MQEASLDGCREKIRRARTHHECLNRRIETFNETYPYAVDEKFDPETRKYEAWFKAPENPDALLWGVIVGDFIHNLRSALDQLVGQLVLASGGKRIGGGTQYPIATRGAEYWCATKDGKPSTRDRCLKGVAEEYRTAVDQTQPYRGGQSAKRESLTLLNWLSNVDKHRAIHPTWAFFESVRREHFQVIGDADVILDIDAERGQLQDGAKILTMTIQTDPPDAEVEMKGLLPIEIGFGERLGGRGGVRHSGLEVIGQRVEGIVASFAALFPELG